MRISRVRLSAALLTAFLSSATALAQDCRALVGETFLADQGTPPLNFSEKRADGIYLNQVIPPGQKFLITGLTLVHYGADTYTVLTRDARQLTITCSQLQSALDPTYPTQHVRKAASEDFSGAQTDLKAKLEADEAELQRMHDEEERARQDLLAREVKRKKQERDAAMQERADALKYREQRIARGGVRIGMSEQQVLDSSWGEPDKRNHTLTAQGDSEQWVYRDQYFLYFVNGVLTGVQTDSPDSGYFRVAH